MLTVMQNMGAVKNNIICSISKDYVAKSKLEVQLSWSLKKVLLPPEPFAPYQPEKLQQIT